jgi:hypothetical protein
MHHRRFACFLLGLWLGGGLLMAWIGLDASRSVDRLLAQSNPAAMLHIRALGPAETRLLLQYQASEEWRGNCATWETAQIVLGAFFFFYLLFGTLEGKFSLLLALLMLAVVLFERFLLTPELVGIGRLLDFVPDIPSNEHSRLAAVQTGYVGAEVLKGTLGCILAARLVWQQWRSGYAGKEIDLVNKANHRHVDR